MKCHIINNEGDCRVCTMRLRTELSQNPRSAIFVFNDTLFVLLCLQLPSQMLLLLKTSNFQFSVYPLYQL